jgi:hypothetical protein
MSSGSTFDGHDYRELRGWLVEPARAVNRGAALVAALFEELRRRRIVAPRISVLERLARESRRQARSELHRSLVCDLDDAQREQLEGLLEVKQSRRTVLGWLREPSGVASVTNLLKHLERLRFARALGIPAEWAERTHPNRLRQLAREGLRVSVSHLRQYEPDRRLATLVAIVLEGMASLTDEILEMHERVLGSFFKKAERLHLERFETNARAINEKVVLYSRVGQALIEARAVASDPFAAIDAAVGWERFIKSVEEANALAHSEDFDWLGISRHYSQLRRYAPELLETFTFEPTPASEDVVKAVEILKALNAKDQRELPDDVPTGFVRRRWEPHVFKEGGIDRRFYELCAMSEVTNSLRSGDLAVKGSRQFRDFEAYLLPKPVFEDLQQKAGLTLPIDTDFPRYFDARAAQLQDELARVELMAQHGTLPDAEIADGRLRISPLSASGDDETDRWSERMYRLLPRVRITDLLTEVDRWTSFTRHFTHLRSGEPAKDTRLLLTAVLADAINLGPTRMTQACPGTSLAKLLQVGDWHVRDETYAKALAEIVNHHHQMPLAGLRERRPVS